MMTRTTTWGMWTTPTHIHSRHRSRAGVTPCAFYDAQAWGPARHTAAPPTPTKCCAANTPNASTTAAGSPPQPKRSQATPPDTASTANWNRPSSGRSATSAGIRSSPSPSTPPGPTSSAQPSTGVGTASPATSPWSPTRSPPTGPPTRRVLSVVGFPADAAGPTTPSKAGSATPANKTPPPRAPKRPRRRALTPGEQAALREALGTDKLADLIRDLQNTGALSREITRALGRSDSWISRQHPRPGRRPRQRRLPSSPGQVRPDDSSAA